MAGATQWKAACPHIDDSPRDVCFHSEISQNNVKRWELSRLPEGVMVEDLKDVLEYVGEDATVAVCNSCRRINVLGDGVTVLHSGDPHFNDRKGDWQVDLDAELESNGIRRGADL